MTISVLTSSTPCMRSTVQQSICAFHCFRGRIFARPKRLSKCTRFSICEGRSPVLSMFPTAHSTAKCNVEIFGVEENLTRSSVAEYLSGARVEFILDPLDIGMGHNREIGTLWEVLSE